MFFPYLILAKTKMYFKFPSSHNNHKNGLARLLFLKFQPLVESLLYHHQAVLWPSIKSSTLFLADPAMDFFLGI